MFKTHHNDYNTNSPYSICEWSRINFKYTSWCRKHTIWRYYLEHKKCIFLKILTWHSSYHYQHVELHEKGSVLLNKQKSFENMFTAQLTDSCRMWI